jgi:hypothetical protein
MKTNRGLSDALKIFGMQNLMVEIDILNANWSDFSDTIRSQRAMQQVLTQFSLIRNVIAHSNDLSEDEIDRLKLLIKDWFRIQS